MTGLWAAIAVGIFAMNTPDAFGICGISHPRDMIDFVFNKLFSTNFILSNYSLTIPILTYVGIVGGAMLSAYTKKELHLRSVPQRAAPVIYGFAVANFGMLMGFCSVRAIMLLAYGDLLAVPGLVGIISGVLIACRYVKWSVKLRD